MLCPPWLVTARPTCVSLALATARGEGPRSSGAALLSLLRACDEGGGLSICPYCLPAAPCALTRVYMSIATKGGCLEGSLGAGLGVEVRGQAAVLLGLHT